MHLHYPKLQITLTISRIEFLYNDNNNIMHRMTYPQVLLVKSSSSGQKV